MTDRPKRERVTEAEIMALEVLHEGCIDDCAIGDELRPFVYRLLAERDRLEADNQALREELKRWREDSYKQISDEIRFKIATLRKERDALLGFKASVDEALNSGDGVYRP